MDLILMVLALALLGFVSWLITTKIPMDPIFKVVIYVVVAVALILYLVRRFSGNVPNVLN